MSGMQRWDARNQARLERSNRNHLSEDWAEKQRNVNRALLAFEVVDLLAFFVWDAFSVWWAIAFALAGLAVAALVIVRRR